MLPAPDWLSPQAKDEWARITPELYALQLLSRLDLAVVAAYCQAMADWIDAIEQVKATGGPIVKSPTGYPIQNPYVSLRNTALKQLLATAAELGLSPAARTRIKAQTAAEAPADGKGRFFTA